MVREKCSMTSALVDLILLIGVVAVAISNMQTNKKLRTLQTALIELKPAIAEFSKAVDKTNKSVSEMKSASQVMEQKIKQSESITQHRNTEYVEPRREVFQPQPTPQPAPTRVQREKTEFVEDDTQNIMSIVQKALENEEKGGITMKYEEQKPEELKKKAEIVDAFFKMAGKNK